MEKTYFFKSSRPGVLNAHRTEWKDFQVECSCPGWRLSPHGCWHCDRVAKLEMDAWQKMKNFPWPAWYCAEDEWDRLSPATRLSAMRAMEKARFEEACR